MAADTVDSSPRTPGLGASQRPWYQVPFRLGFVQIFILFEGSAPMAEFPHIAKGEASEPRQAAYNGPTAARNTAQT